MDSADSEHSTQIRHRLDRTSTHNQQIGDLKQSLECVRVLLCEFMSLKMGTPPVDKTLSKEAWTAALSSGSLRNTVRGMLPAYVSTKKGKRQPSEQLALVASLVAPTPEEQAAMASIEDTFSVAGGLQVDTPLAHTNTRRTFDIDST